ncbi:hypothetical protein ABD67_20445 [Bacillus sonorensis]|uniref:Uncharacterized protein n=1 Tax=Bacillus sonorensis L12 TaxID=1274524 RepID=M5PE15_9BACI|nr:hypothetical protein BSONL12_10726 [Bacillus sonorensis L12]MBG9917148.1 hypothetical protein [Bacillus sonorensis]TWK72012.1 hypothetical protein CHCC20335_2708 [Bacillus paralicheniformis]
MSECTFAINKHLTALQRNEPKRLFKNEINAGNFCGRNLVCLIEKQTKQFHMLSIFKRNIILKILTFTSILCQWI